MKNQFFYTRKIEAPVQIKGQETKYTEYEDSFNPELVIRSVLREDGVRVVLLNDIHERLEYADQLDSKRRKVGVTKQRNTVQSEIYLSKEDGERYKKLTSIE